MTNTSLLKMAIEIWLFYPTVIFHGYLNVYQTVSWWTIGRYTTGSLLGIRMAQIQEHLEDHQLLKMDTLLDSSFSGRSGRPAFLLDFFPSHVFHPSLLLPSKVCRKKLWKRSMTPSSSSLLAPSGTVKFDSVGLGEVQWERFQCFWPAPKNGFFFGGSFSDQACRVWLEMGRSSESH